MEYRADLHTHSTASDGQYKPADLVEKAQKAGVEVLALTDHDTIDGVEEAICAGRRQHGAADVRRHSGNRSARAYLGIYNILGIV